LSGDAPAGDGNADVIVVAAGRSARMGGADKLLLDIGGRPLLAWTLAAVASAPVVGRIVVVTAAERTAELAAATWLPAIVTDVVAGGGRRQESVAAGFAALDRDGSYDGRVVLVHDAARPLVSPALVASVAEATARHGAAIPVVPVAETLKRVEDGVVTGTVERDGLAAAQTPQGVRRDLLREAYRRFPADGPETWTDEASLLEACSIHVHVVQGDPGNLKVTVPGDVPRAIAGLAAVSRFAGGAAFPEVPNVTLTARTGIGHDSHPFGPGAPLVLGGVEIPGAPRLHGHSDGDAALHAVADALLGAAGLGDLGRLFPSDARTPRGIDSRELLAEVRRRVEAGGFWPTSVDVTVVGARPRLADHLDGMATTIAGLLGLPRAAVNVKASTGNLDGAEGAGRSISALAIATLGEQR
jgi:2-C-methyl-D-erythritol 4-phosphate cytidylyltransferase/2-C-methyl-D-erythritol 2,4-cyclodiphosphate synthase